MNVQDLIGKELQVAVGLAAMNRYSTVIVELDGNHIPVIPLVEANRVKIRVTFGLVVDAEIG